MANPHLSTNIAVAGDRVRTVGVLLSRLLHENRGKFKF